MVLFFEKMYLNAFLLNLFHLKPFILDTRKTCVNKVCFKLFYQIQNKNETKLEINNKVADEVYFNLE
jgi:hypothetical protein